MDIRDARLECADNGGYILRYSEVVKGNGTYGCNDYKNKEEIFPDEKELEALKRLKELSGKSAPASGSVKAPAY